MPEITWFCEPCGDRRPDEKISVLSRRREIFGVVMTENVRYCNDREECREGAGRIGFHPGRRGPVAPEREDAEPRGAFLDRLFDWIRAGVER